MGFDSPRTSRRDDPEWPGWENGDFNTGKINGFECNLVWTSGSTQPIVYAGYNQGVAKKGKVRVRKTSANAAVTKGNPCYSLKGAQFAVYSDKACKNKVGSMTTGADGQATSGELDAGTYWVRETAAPQGYLLDSTARQVSVPAGGEGTVDFADQPATDPAWALVQKRDADTGKADPQGAGTLAGAEFTFKFYVGWYDKASALPAKPTRQWVFKTNANGVVNLSASNKVSGDEFYKDKSGNFTLPNGTLTIQETKAPSGYLIDDKSVHLQKIAHGGALKSEIAYNTIIVKESVGRGGISVQKCDAETGQASPQGAAAFAGAQFAVRNKNAAAVVVGGRSYAKDADVLTLTLDGAGRASTAADALPLGTYSVRETKAPAGYLPTPGEHLVKLTKAGAIVPATHS